MELTFSTENERTIVDDVVDCKRTDSGYEIRTSPGDTELIDSHFVGAITAYHETGQSTQDEYESLAIKLITDDTLRTPHRPLARGSALEDDDWKFESGYDFNIPEILAQDGACLVRNATRFWVVGVEATSGQPPQRLDTHNGGYLPPADLATKNTYQADLASAWQSGPLTGTIERLTTYRDAAFELGVKNAPDIAPSADTADQVSWAFPDLE